MGKVGRYLKKFLFLAVLIGVLALGLPYAAGYYHHAMSHETTDDAFIDGHIVGVSPRVSGQVLRVHVKDNQHVKKGDLLVDLDPADFEVQVARAHTALKAAIARQQSAKINVGVTETTSSAGITQARSGLEVAVAGVRQSESQLASARIAVSQAQAQVMGARATAQQERAQIAAAQADAVKAASDVKRYRQLYERDELPRQQLDHAIAASQSANARLEAARRSTAASEARVMQAMAAQRAAEEALRLMVSQIEAAQGQVRVEQGRVAAANVAPQQVAARVSEVETAGAEIAQARVAVKQAELQLSYCRIRAAQDGRVTRKAVEPGAFVQAGQALMALVPDEVWVVANFKETQLTGMKPGQPVTIHVDAYPGKVFKAHVDSIQRGTGARFSVLPPENATGNYVKVVQRVPVKIVFDEPVNGEYVLGPGMSVVPEVRLK